MAEPQEALVGHTSRNESLTRKAASKSRSAFALLPRIMYRIPRLTASPTGRGVLGDTHGANACVSTDVFGIAGKGGLIAELG